MKLSKKIPLESLPRVSELKKPSSEDLKSHFKKAASRNNWINIFVILASIYFVWNTGVAIQHNRKLDAKLNSLASKATLLEEANKNLELQKNYYSSKEYQTKALKTNFNLVSPGENVLIVKNLPEPQGGSDNIFSRLQELRQLINN
jgi:hypothetical protein